MLPCALYSCCYTQTSKALVAGVSRADGTITALSPIDIGVCLSAWETLGEMQTNTTFAWLKDENFTWKTPKHCTEIRNKTIHKIWYPHTYFLGLERWSAFIGRDRDAEENSIICEIDLDGMCISCKEIAESSHSRGRVEFWNRLPKAFGLPGWEELAEERTVSTTWWATRFLLAMYTTDIYGWQII